MSDITKTTAISTTDDDLVELAFSALAPEQSIELEDRVYPVGVHADRPRPF
jgi:hypothetical protein